MDKNLAYFFVVLLGSSFLEYYSTDFPLFSLFLVAVALVTLAILFSASHRDADGARSMWVLHSSDVVAWTFVLLIPMLLMALSDRSFDRGVWTTKAFLVVEFVLGAHMASKRELRTAIMYGALTVVVVGAATNLFEMFIQPNTWSLSPGRAAGFYVNPNSSASCIVGFGVIYFAFRPRHVQRLDLVVLGLICSGVFVTFSRTGYLMLIAPALMCYLVRTDFAVSWRSVARLGVVLVAAVLFFAIFVELIMPHVDLSKDASRRLASVLEMTIGQDFSSERAGLAKEAWMMFAQSPITGVGVGTSTDMKLGPHNMFAAVALDYGIIGLLVYVLLILRLLWSGIAGRRDRSVAFVAIATVAWLITLSFTSHHVLVDSPILLLVAIAVTMSSQVHGSSVKARRMPPRDDTERRPVHRMSTTNL